VQLVGAASGEWPTSVVQLVGAASGECVCWGGSMVGLWVATAVWRRGRDAWLASISMAPASYWSSRINDLLDKIP
jgi:hypothetical protein